MTASEWCENTKALLDELKENGYYSTECQLFEAYMWVLSGREDEARRLLDSLENNQRVKDEEILEGAFLYLDEISHRSTQLKERQQCVCISCTKDVWTAVCYYT